MDRGECSVHWCFEHVRNDLNLLRKEEDGLEQMFSRPMKKHFKSLMRRYWPVEMKLHSAFLPYIENLLVNLSRCKLYLLLSTNLLLWAGYLPHLESLYIMGWSHSPSIMRSFQLQSCRHSICQLSALEAIWIMGKSLLHIGLLGHKIKRMGKYSHGFSWLSFLPGNITSRPSKILG